MISVDDLPAAFEFVFIQELNGAGYLFRLVRGSSKCYLAEDLKDLLKNEFDECLSLLAYQDLSETPIREIKLPILQRLKFDEIQATNQLSSLDIEDKWLVKLMRF